MGFIIVPIIFFGIVWLAFVLKSSESFKEKRINAGRADDLKYLSIKHNNPFSRKADKALRKKLSRYNLAFPFSPKIRNVTTLMVHGFKTETFDYSYQASGEMNAPLIEIGGLVISFDGYPFPQFCISQQNELIQSPLIGGDEISQSQLPEWASKVSIKTSKKNTQQVRDFLESDPAVIDIINAPFVQWLFFNKDFILLYFSDPLPDDDSYFSIAFEHAAAIIDLYGAKFSPEIQLKNLKKDQD